MEGVGTLRAHIPLDPLAASGGGRSLRSVSDARQLAALKTGRPGISGVRQGHAVAGPSTVQARGESPCEGWPVRSNFARKGGGGRCVIDRVWRCAAGRWSRVIEVAGVRVRRPHRRCTVAGFAGTSARDSQRYCRRSRPVVRFASRDGA